MMSNTESSGPLLLLAEDLREVVSRAFDRLEKNDASDEECRECCTIVLGAIGRFLYQWTGLIEVQADGQKSRGEDESSSEKFPLGFLRETASKIVREVGPGDSLFRTNWLDILRRSTAKSVVALSFLLEFLPSVVSPKQDEDNVTKNEILATLDFVLEKDSNALSPILDCLQKLVRKQKIEESVVFQFIIDHMSTVREDGIGRVTESLLDIARGESQLTAAIQAIRNVCVSDIAILSAAAAIDGIRREGRRLEFFDEYLATVEEHVCNQGNPNKAECTLKCVDVLFLLIHRGLANYEQTIKKTLDHTLVNGVLDKRVLSCVARFAGFFEHDALLGGGVQDLHDHLVWFLIFLCLSPLRGPKTVAPEKALQLAKEFGVDILLRSDERGKHRVIAALLQLAEECRSTVMKASTSSPTSQSNPLNVLSAPVDSSTLLKIHSVVFAMLDAVAGKFPHVLRHHIEIIRRSLEIWCIGDETVKSICSLMVLVNSHTSTSWTEDGLAADSLNDPLFVARALLFSRNSDDCAPPVICEAVAIEKCVRGLVLASKMVSSSHQNSTQVSLLWQLVTSALLPPTNRLPSPRCGNFGLLSLQSFHSWNQNVNQDSAVVWSRRIFATLTSILVTSRLVQYANTSPTSSRPKDTALRYSIRPDWVTDDATKPRKFHKMVFSFAALRSDLNFSSPSNWELSSKFVFELIDMYLCLGRTRSKGKWIPHAWVEAAFDFPLIDLSNLRASNSRQLKMLNIVEGTMNDFDACIDVFATNGASDKEFAEMLKQMKKRLERTEMVHCLLHSAMSYCLGLALSASILRNTFAHYAGILNEQDSEDYRQQRVEATRLMQYQLAKIYDLAGKCQVIEAVLRGISNANLRARRRIKNSNRGGKSAGLQFDNKELHTDIRTASDQLRLILSSVASTDEYVESKVLWYCLVDPSHDILLIKRIESDRLHCDASPMELEDHYDAILGLRLNILKHLTGHLRRFSDRTSNDSSLTPSHMMVKELTGIQSFFAQCLRLAAFFLSNLPGAGGTGFDADEAKQLSSLTAAYIRLLFVSMEICLSIHRKETSLGMDQKSKLPSFSDFVCLYRCILGAERPLTDAIAMEDTDLAQNPASFKSTINSLLNHLTRCNDTGIATELLQTLSVLSLHSKQDEAIVQMVRISWTGIHSRFSGEADDATNTPFSLIEALKRLSPGAILTSDQKTIKDTTIRETVLKSAFGKSKFQGKHIFLVQGMLRHWGFLVLSNHLSPSCADHLHQLYAYLQSFLGEVSESLAPKHRIQKDENLSGEDDEYLPPKRPRLTKVESVFPESAVPGLNHRSYFAYFQTLLDMTVSSCALFTVNDADRSDPLDGPYQELCKLVETFGSLVVLYRKWIHVFPQQGLPSVLNTCRSMLNVVGYQSTQCIEWRSSQPIQTAEQIEAKVFDPASVQFLSLVLDVFGVHVVATLGALCDSIESFSTSAEYQNIGALFGLAQRQKVKALRLKIHKVSSDLEKFAIAHKLPTPRQSFEEKVNEQLASARKRRRIEIGGFLQSAEACVDGKNIQASSLRLHTPVANTHVQPGQNDEGRTISSELTWEEGSSEDDDSFGADGDWGRDSEDDDEIRINAGI